MLLDTSRYGRPHKPGQDPALENSERARLRREERLQAAIEVALYDTEFRPFPETGWLRQVVPFTTDLDLVARELSSR